MNRTDVRSLWDRARTPSSWIELVPEASIGEGLDLTPVAPHGPCRLDAFELDGYASAPILARTDALRAAACVRRVRDAGLPTVFAYVYDELWTPLRAIIGHLEARVGPCEPLADGWAWIIEPGVGRGWVGHRGSEVLHRDAAGRPQMINVWLALSDVTERHSTMAVVPRSLDPHHPDRLDQAPDVEGETLTAATGEALYWDANVYHWGTRSHPDAVGPRISSSYTIVTDQRPGTLQAPTLDLHERLRLIAEWIVTYEGMDPTLTPEAKLWARLWSATGRT